MFLNDNMNGELKHKSHLQILGFIHNYIMLYIFNIIIFIY